MIWRIVFKALPDYNYSGSFEECQKYAGYMLGDPSIDFESIQTLGSGILSIQHQATMSSDEPIAVVDQSEQAFTPQPFAISNPPLLVTIASQSFQLWGSVWVDPTAAEPLLEAGLLEALAAEPKPIDSVEEIVDEAPIPPFVSGIPDVEPIAPPPESIPPANIIIPDIQEMAAEEAIAAINGITGEDEATVLALLLDAEEAGKKRKTVIAAIKERAGFAQ